MLKRNSLLMIGISLILISTISATGLNIEGDFIFQVNKTIGVDETIIFEIKNTDSFTFHNVSIDSPYITMDIIEDLTPGESQTVTATIISDSNIDRDITISALYESDLGESNESYDLNINYLNGIDECYFSIIQGDSVTWVNNVNDEIKMINSDTTLEISTLLDNTNYTSLFSLPQILNYHFLRRGFQFTEYCQLVVLGSSGFIYNPSYDTYIRLKITTDYDPTTISTTFTETNYTMNYNDNIDGIFTIKNTGDDVAKNIQLIGDWFSFSDNNFDLAPQQTKGIVYTILPILTNTNNTNKSHHKNITILGNFDTHIQDIDIFVNYVDVDSGNYTSSTSLADLLNEYCELNPDVCNPDPKIIYANPNKTLVNITVATEQLRDIIDFMFVDADARVDFQNYIKEEISNIYGDMNFTRAEMLRLTELTEASKEDRDNSNSFLIVVFIGFILLVIGGAAFYLVFDAKKQKKIEMLRRW